MALRWGSLGAMTEVLFNFSGLARREQDTNIITKSWYGHNNQYWKLNL